MSNHDYPTTRKASAIVKCPHCSHTGSARGLFSHVRLAHPGIVKKPVTATKITVHPYDIKGMGHVKDTIHRIETMKKRKAPEPSVGETILVSVVLRLFEELAKRNNLKSINTSEKGLKTYLSAINGIKLE